MSSKTSTLDQFDEELKNFLKYCKEKNFSDREIDKLFEPMVGKMDLVTRVSDIKHFIITTVAIIIGLYCLTYFDLASWNMTAIGRILMIEILPLFEWRHLKDERCLIPNLLKSEEQVSLFNCELCEAMYQIHTVNSTIDPDLLRERYIQLHNPVLVSDALLNWPMYRNYNLSNLQGDDAISNSIPCRLATNTHTGVPKLGTILRRLHMFEEYFLHFQNCDFDATKAFRMFSPRPKYLPAEISPVQYNWLLASRHYNVSHYKLIELKEPITVVGQVAGSNYYRLLPRRNCKTECPTMEIALGRGESLIFTSLWDLEYKPDPGTENGAVILEMH